LLDQRWNSRPLSKVRIWVCVQDCRWQQSN